MRCVLACVAVSAATPARADDALTARARAEQPPQLVLDLPSAPPFGGAARSGEAGPFDPTLAPVLLSLRAQVGEQRAGIDLTSRLSLERTIALWNDETTDALGWRWQARLAYELGSGLRLVATGGAGAVQSRFGSDLYYDVGIGIAKLWRLSRWTTAWLSLTAGYRMSPSTTVGEGTVMLRVGFTFR